MWTDTGLVRYHVLFVMRLATREGRIAGIVPKPDGQWMNQMARNLTDAEDGLLRGYRYLIRDRSSLFNDQFRETLRSAGVESLKLPAPSLNLNDNAERFVRTIKESCLDNMILFGEAALHERGFFSSLNMIIRNETTRGSRTKSSALSSPSFQQKDRCTVVKGSAAFELLLPKSRIKIGSFEFVDSTGSEKQAEREELR